MNDLTLKEREALAYAAYLVLVKQKRLPEGIDHEAIYSGQAKLAVRGVGPRDAA